MSSSNSAKGLKSLKSNWVLLLLAVLLGAQSLAYGGGNAWYRALFQCGLGVLLVLAVLLGGRNLQPTGRLLFALVPVALFACIVAVPMIRREVVLAEAYGQILIYGCYVGVFVLAAMAGNRPVQWVHFFVILFGVALIQVFWAMGQAFAGWSLPGGFGRPAAYEGRGSGLFVNPNNFASFLILLAPVALAILIFGGKRFVVRILSGYAFVMILLGIGFSQSRGGWGACAAGLLFFSLLLAVQLRGWRRWCAFGLGMAMLAGVILAALYYQPFNSRLKHTVVAESGAIRDFRPEIWRTALKVWETDPWFGIGANQFQYEFRQFRGPWLQNQPRRVHNDYLNVLTEHGVFGLAMVTIGLALVGGTSAYHLFRRSSNGDQARSERSLERGLIIGVMAGMAGVLVHALIDFPFYNMPVGCLFAAFVACLCALGRAESSARRPRSPVAPGILFVTCVIVGGVIAWCSVQPARAAHYKQQAVRADRWGESVPWLDRLVEVAPNSPEDLRIAADAHRRHAFLGNPSYEEDAQKAMDLYARIQELAPLDPYGWMHYGMCLDWLGRHEEAEHYFLKGWGLDPENQYTEGLVGWHYFQSENYAKSLEWFQKARQTPHFRDDMTKAYLDLLTRRGVR